ncbi:YggT family protein [Hazenella sp. IB182357]|uniref:YggT family protein n=1 Tax=Polycladospora coralii TaxID=2771432 RepID=A0A926RT74_9BACL|nr:YggT family protein [Polycladospora coralii]MBD1371338.1 YggT family protein [Polycladospora coralii]MBS7530306.1 YggT family protein [Polycladospora coralii]
MNILFSVLDWAFMIYYVMIIVYILMSWLPNVQSSPIGQVIGRLVEPYLAVFRRFIPPLGMIDLSPIVAIIALRFIQSGLFTVIAWIVAMVA